VETEKQVLEHFGYGFKFFNTGNQLQRRKYYSKDGREMVLPADPYSLRHYLSKGFTLTPPEKPAQADVVTVATETQPSGQFVCPECGKEAKDHVGLAIHRRKTHNPKRHYRSTRRTIEPAG